MLSEARLATRYEQVQHLDARGLQGALVECGTWKGGAVGMMALANRDTHAVDELVDRILGHDAAPSLPGVLGGTQELAAEPLSESVLEGLSTPPRAPACPGAPPRGS